MRVLPANTVLLYGHHDNCDPTNNKFGCVMDIVSYICEYDTITDQPQCACPVLTKFAIDLNDSIKDDQLRTELLLPLVVKLAGSRSTRGVEQRRAFYFADRAVRLFAPLALEARGLIEQADTLRQLPEVVNKEIALAAALACSAAARTAVSAANAVYAAANAAANAAYAAVNTSATAAVNTAANAAYAAVNTSATDVYKQAAQVLDTATQIN